MIKVPDDSQDQKMVTEATTWIKAMIITFK